MLSCCCVQGSTCSLARRWRFATELAHAEFVRLVVAEAYAQGAAYVHVEWTDTPTQRALLLNADLEQWNLPAYEIARHHQMVDEHWCALALVGPEFPFAFDDVPPERTRTLAVKRSRAIKFYTEAIMANQQQWCVAAVATPAWAQRVYPDLGGDAAVAALWQDILQFVRADRPDPVAAWDEINRTLTVHREATSSVNVCVRSISTTPHRALTASPPRT